MQFDLVSVCAGFLLGTLTGAAGMYYGDYFTDQRRKQEKAGEVQSLYFEVREQMPQIVEELRKVLGQRPMLRDIAVTASGKVVFMEPPLYTHEVSLSSGTAHGGLQILENRGYVRNVTTGNLPTYRMTEEFVGLLTGAK